MGCSRGGGNKFKISMESNPYKEVDTESSDDNLSNSYANKERCHLLKRRIITPDKDIDRNSSSTNRSSDLEPKPSASGHIPSSRVPGPAVSKRIPAKRKLYTESYSLLSPSSCQAGKSDVNWNATALQHRKNNGDISSSDSSSQESSDEEHDDRHNTSLKEKDSCDAVAKPTSTNYSRKCSSEGDGACIASVRQQESHGISDMHLTSEKSLGESDREHETTSNILLRNDGSHGISNIPLTPRNILTKNADEDNMPCHKSVRKRDSHIPSTSKKSPGVSDGEYDTPSSIPGGDAGSCGTSDIPLNPRRSMRVKAKILLSSRENKRNNISGHLQDIVYGKLNRRGNNKITSSVEVSRHEGDENDESPRQRVSAEKNSVIIPRRNIRRKRLKSFLS
ncbi:hypothetical protein SK128_024448 [Halocaridina rubra]|uniref:Uncharacterized protein n=1 Tax=Halocaridina rubra TaxID=373956 RepID=A0AAN8WDQ8_HALRR